MGDHAYWIFTGFMLGAVLLFLLGFNALLLSGWWAIKTNGGWATKVAVVLFNAVVVGFSLWPLWVIARELTDWRIATGAGVFALWVLWLARGVLWRNRVVRVR